MPILIIAIVLVIAIACIIRFAYVEQRRRRKVNKSYPEYLLERERTCDPREGRR